jgi:hypothetical protein
MIVNLVQWWHKFIFVQCTDCFSLHITADLYTPLPPKIYWHIQGNGDIGKQKDDDSLTRDFITVVRQDYFV